MVAGKTNTDDVLKLLKTPNKSRQKLEDFKVCLCVCEEQIALSCLSLEKILIYIYSNKWLGEQEARNSSRRSGKN